MQTDLLPFEENISVPRAEPRTISDTRTISTRLREYPRSARVSSLQELQRLS